MSSPEEAPLSSPEEAVRRARQAAAQHAAESDQELLAISPAPDDTVDLRKLIDWALIDPDIEQVRSTRRYGRAMTAFKRGLLRLLVQYHADLTAQQTRFNLALITRIGELEARIEELERERATRS